MSQLDYVSARLSQSQASLLRSGSLADGTSLALWRNRLDHTNYHKPGHHTLSLYTAGGAGTHRTDQPERGSGAPGMLCVLPAGHMSDWIINSDFSFLHFYFADRHLGALAEQILDVDPSRVQLRDETYVQDPLISSLLSQVILPADWRAPSEQLGLSQALSLALQRLLRAHCEHRYLLPVVKGGLAPVIKRLIGDYIEAHLAEPLTISQLAQQAHLSEYHFARMFSQSFGVTPRQYVLERRIEKARELVCQSSLPLAAIALECGFANQAHFTRLFRRNLGNTPGALRRQCSLSMEG